MKVTQGSKTFKVEVDGNLCFETEKVKLPPGYHFGVSAITSDTPDSFELFSVLVSSMETYHTPGKPHQAYEEVTEGAGRIVRDRGAVGQRAPHEVDYEEYVPEFKDASAETYKTPDQQFTDVHNRLQGMTHHLAAIQSQLGMLYDRLDALTHRHDDMRAEARGTRVPRTQVDEIANKM